MWIHWKKKKMRFNHKGQRITLTGIMDCLSKSPPLKPRKLQGLLRKGGVAQLVQLSPLQSAPLQTQTSTVPEPVHQLLQENANLFKDPIDLPPHRSLDHKIDLVPGAH